MHPLLHRVFSFEGLIRFVFGCSVASLLLPPVSMFAGFPRFQKFYAKFVDLVQYYGSLNLRDKIAQAYSNYKIKGDNSNEESK